MVSCPNFGTAKESQKWKTPNRLWCMYVYKYIYIYIHIYIYIYIYIYMFILLMEQSHNHPVSHHATTFSPAFKAKKCVTRPLVFFAGSARNPSSTAFAERSQTWKPNDSRYGGDPNKIEGEASRKGLWSHLYRFRTVSLLRTPGYPSQFHPQTKQWKWGPNHEKHPWRQTHDYNRSNDQSRLSNFYQTLFMLSSGVAYFSMAVLKNP